MIVQLHWMHRTDYTKTVFVAQAEFDDASAAHAWAAEVIERRKSECPAECGPMVCTEDSPAFVRSPGAAGGKA